LAPPAGFSAAQDCGAGTLTAALRTAAGGALTARARAHPQADVVAVNVSWAPGDGSSLTLDVCTWVLGDGHIAGSWNTGVPAPASAGCAAASGGAAVPCGAGAGAASQLLFVSRNASTVSADVMPVSAALAAGAILGPGAAQTATSVTSAAPVSPPTLPWEVCATLTLPAGAWAAVVVAEAETRGPGLADPVPAALAAAAAVIAGPPTALDAAADAFWGEFWSRSRVALPSRPGAEALWLASQYFLAAASSSREDASPPGLYGPWVTADGPNWCVRARG
jgi:hypothetical protein